ncbi:MAG TPA: hypothetical protein VFJ58_23215 [Armatimonadota bacterium]|nr:hypothetical protein [Armatimonadota bacterium]
MRLFVERATWSEPEFRLTTANRAAVVRLCDLAGLARRQGDLARAREIVEEALATARTTRSTTLQTLCLNYLAFYHYLEGNRDQMESQCRESLGLAAEAGEMERIAAALRRFGVLNIQRKNIPRASCLLGAADRLQNEIGVVFGMEQEILAEAGRHLALNSEDPASRAAWDKGHAMSWEQAVAYALE